MALKFQQATLPPGVNHILLDDGTDVIHVFNECARWTDVADAAGLGSTVYAETKWQRRHQPASSVARLAAQLRPIADGSVAYERVGQSLVLVASHGFDVAGWESLPVTIDAPVTAALRTGLARLYRNAAEMEAEHPGLRGCTNSVHGTFLALPVSDKGAILLAWADEKDERQVRSILSAARS